MTVTRATLVRYRGLLGPITAVLLFLIGVRWSPFEPHAPPATPSGGAMGTASWMDEDWDRFEGLVTAATDAGVAELPIGEAMARIGQSLVGTAYVPGTLEVPGAERLVINFRGLDCVTFVENVYALAVVVKGGIAARLQDRPGAESEYELVLASLRYRDGYIDGYPSRLHYFSDWIADNDRRQIVTDITAELGGVVDPEPVDFMSSHPEAYRQLSETHVVAEIVAAERRLSARGRVYLPKQEIAAVASRIRNGDIIAATSTVRGLDVAHTGIALWVDGTLRLMHAPLVGSEVQVSEESLADRIADIPGQDGIMVARPVEPRPSPARSQIASR